MAGSRTPATDLLSRLKISFTVHEYETGGQPASYGLAASEALGVPPERLFKTLVAEVDDQLAVGVVPPVVAEEAGAEDVGGADCALFFPVTAETTAKAPPPTGEGWRR